MTKVQEWRQRIAGYQASKAAVVWACVGSVAATWFVGFVVAGWVTEGTAAKLAEQAADKARIELAAAVCVDRFMNAPEAVKRRAALEQESYWKRPDLIEAGGWTKLPGVAEPVDGLATECASRIIEAKVPTGITAPGAG
jgi:hypothetical protein